MFQFLIGSLGAIDLTSVPSAILLFQFLIGSLGTIEQNDDIVKYRRVSIPYR